MIAFLLAAAAALAADRATKRFAGGARRETGRLPKMPALLVLATLTAGLVVVVLRGPLGASTAGSAGLGAAIGGAAANAIDQLRHGGVIDFIRVGRWPVFNFADAAIVAGTMTALWSVL